MGAYCNQSVKNSYSESYGGIDQQRKVSPMTEVVVSISGDREVMAKLQKLGNGVLNLQRPMTDIGDYLTGFFSGQVFASRGQVIGERWKPLNPRYAAQKAQRWPGRPPLIRTGLMQRSFKKNAGRMSVEVFNRAPHFDYHQGGTRRLPARVMMKVDQTRERRIVDIINADIVKALS